MRANSLIESSRSRSRQPVQISALFHVAQHELWFTDNGRDWLGDDQPPDELNRVSHPGEHFGFPYCHGDSLRDPEYNGGRSCAQFTPPARALGPHVAAIGSAFTRAGSFRRSTAGESSSPSTAPGIDRYRSATA